MSIGKGNNLRRSFGNRVFFYSLTNLLLVAFGWLAGWWLKGHSFAAYANSDYFSNYFRILFVVYIVVEALIDFVVSPRWIRPMDEVPHEWLHWRARMWETVLVVAVFSDCMGILPISSGSVCPLGWHNLISVGIDPLHNRQHHAPAVPGGYSRTPFPNQRNIRDLSLSGESIGHNHRDWNCFHLQRLGWCV